MAARPYRSWPVIPAMKSVAAARTAKGGHFPAGLRKRVVAVDSSASHPYIFCNPLLPRMGDVAGPIQQAFSNLQNEIAHSRLSNRPSSGPPLNHRQDFECAHPLEPS
jgi:hypothetical protein